MSEVVKANFDLSKRVAELERRLDILQCKVCNRLAITNTLLSCYKPDCPFDCGEARQRYEAAMR